MRVLITGGVKSGKSSRALGLALENFSPPRYFIATAEKTDAEMEQRIARHRGERRGPDGNDLFVTLEEPVDLPGAIARAGNMILVDCIPMWINNLMYYKKTDLFPGFLEKITAAMPENIIFVTNETGLGNIPFDETTRQYNLLLAEANRELARMVHRVEFMVCGIPLTVK
ncbi:bifunctional adenosylcobinamide kinase/adenosylcobinamide-phosphate guanylyltransferase [Breznakiella homolactica]|uniref:Adenosylcobinamide kinase n=1 Tax=Breznakiella homolactica TaxID=2798577 RepID=A0A7T7XJK3_9SPIR|nr:bifunctional adenosylcobinamide kinase/adenosylcobinamide-phosphate guanylyltransferase [Breznakiella homolactica]QQO07480.1 bifunctional adenosylcobinamide kinase/adenosylcobinamide-phosphate guanylyltransferase [Breznakiella homolactica]